MDEAIHLLCSTYLEPGDEAIIVVPTFAMYAIFAQAEGARLVQVLAGENFAFPLEGLLWRGSASERGLIAVANPNNPTGAAVACEILLQIARAAPQAAVLVDEAYFEFHGETILNLAEWPDNLFVARTFSKAYGLAGLRIGILAGDAGQMAMVRRVASPYNVNAAALAVLPEALRDQEYVEQYVAEVQRGRAILEQELSDSRPALLAEPRQLCAGARRPRPCGIHPGFARARNSGARPEFRSRMRRLRAPDCGIDRTYADSDWRAARGGRQT